ncbi:hypothetical protein Gotri_027467 [Gossypium trilobum]|uniref:DUF7745 domain-containing protein n=1 Tax=Gossypium trilobum TaxID=34281 RepID=A0A7J9FU52_9ROSI|nr:hypothetical protein [Gossypium trilobum]
MENEFLDKTEDNVVVRVWSERMQLEKGDSLIEGYTSEFHFWKLDKVSYRVFSESYSPLKELATTPRRDDITEERWITILQNLLDEDIEWKAPWMLPDEILYRCGDFDWVPLLGIWGVVGYASLLVLRQYRSRQFVPTTQGLAQCKFSYKGDAYKKKIREMSNAWNQA